METILNFLMLLLVLLPIAQFVASKKTQPYLNLAFVLAISIPSSWFSITTLLSGQTFSYLFSFLFWGSPLELIIDPLSAFFILVVNFTVITGAIYAIGYLRAYPGKSHNEFALHYMAYAYLHLAMLLVTMLQSGLAFLVAWELMSVSSFLLVIFEGEKRETLSAGVKYLVQMHIGAMLLLVGFVMLDTAGFAMDFRGLPNYFSNHSNWPLFIVFCSGFAIKAGFVPFHTWLPHAHPAAPSHVSGVMSGVMIKMGIYGILRVLLQVQSDLLLIGGIIFVISLVSGLIGVMFAIVQHDLKRLLAYHSIENIGIIGLGIGLGVIGKAINQPALMFLGFAGGILHVLNHSLFKSLLFYGAGSVYIQTHTRDIESLGGLIKKMPRTAILFLIAALAICGLPPFNGFISEFLIYNGLIQGLPKANINLAATLLAGITGLALIGGLAIFCFTKAFGIVFLGSPRSNSVNHAEEIPQIMLIPQYAIIIVILSIGLFPGFYFSAVAVVTTLFTPIDPGILNRSVATLNSVGLYSLAFILLCGGIYQWRKRLIAKQPIAIGPTWGCGYTAPNSRMQYTATSFADSYSQLAKPLLDIQLKYKPIKKQEIFPAARHFKTESEDVFENKLFIRPIQRLAKLLQRASVVQTGQTRHYVLYAFFFMLILFILTFLEII